MSRYSIKELETITGIKAHTIRMWEKRYGILEPKRTETNIRYYTDEELRRLLNVATLNARGIKISKICLLCDDEVQEKIEELLPDSTNRDAYIQDCMRAMMDLNEAEFIDTLNRAIVNIGFEDTMVSIVYPFLNRVGIFWMTGKVLPAQEHFVSNLIRQKLLAETDRLNYRPNKDKPKFVLFLHEHEMHELAILFTNYLLRGRNFPVMYLGQAVPEKDLVEVVSTYKPDFLVTSFFSAGKADDALKVLNSVCDKELGKVLVIDSFLLADRDDLPEACERVTSVQQFKEYLNTMG